MLNKHSNRLYIVVLVNMKKDDYLDIHINKLGVNLRVLKNQFKISNYFSLLIGEDDAFHISVII